MSRDYLYSELNGELVASLLKVNYEGITNDTTKVTVDNINRTIETSILKTPYKLTIFDSDGETINFDGSSDKEVTFNSFSLKEISESENGKRYALYRGDKQIEGSSILYIPFDKRLTNVTIEKCTQPNYPQEGLEVGDYYIVFTMVSSENSWQERLIYPIKNLFNVLFEDVEERVNQGLEEIKDKIENTISYNDALSILKSSNGE